MYHIQYKMSYKECRWVFIYFFVFTNVAVVWIKRTIWHFVTFYFKIYKYIISQINIMLLLLQNKIQVVIRQNSDDWHFFLSSVKKLYMQFLYLYMNAIYLPSLSSTRLPWGCHLRGRKWLERRPFAACKYKLLLLFLLLLLISVSSDTHFIFWLCDSST